MKTIALTFIAFLAASCHRNDPVPSNLSGTEWHWLQNYRSSNGIPTTHVITFSNRSFEYKAQRGQVVEQGAGRYEVSGNLLILYRNSIHDTLTIQKDKLVVKKVGDLFEFYVRVR